MASTTHTTHQRKRTTTSAFVKTVAASAAVAYGTYRFAQWYWKEDDDIEDNNDTIMVKDEAQQHSNRENQSSSSTENDDNLCQRQNLDSSSSLTTSWLSVATDWLTEAAASTISVSTMPTKNPRRQHQTRQHQSSIRHSHPTPVTGRVLRHRLAHCRQKTVTAFLVCLPVVQAIVENLTSASEATSRLKELRKQHKSLSKDTVENELFHKETTSQHLNYLQQQQNDLWRHIVIEHITRMMASSYTYTLLLLSLTVQLHWISGNLESSLSHNGMVRETYSTSTELAQAMLMQSHQYLIEEGVPLLVSTVRRSIETALEESSRDHHHHNIDWTKPTQFLTVFDVEQLLYHQLPRVLKYGKLYTGSYSGTGTASLSRNWVRYVIPDVECFDTVYDICSSPVWEDAQEQILQNVWCKVLRDDPEDGWKRLFEDAINVDHMQSQLPKSSSPSSSSSSSGPQKPVAKVVAQFKKSSQLLLASNGNVAAKNDDTTCSPELSLKMRNHLTVLQRLPSVLELGEVSFQQQQ